MAQLVGYACVSTDKQDAQAQREALAAAGVPLERIYVDSGLTGSNRERPALREALAACDAGSTPFVTKLDRLALSISDANDIASELTAKGSRLSIGGSVHDPNDPIGKLLFNVLTMIAECEGDLDPRPHPRGGEDREGQGEAARPPAQAPPDDRRAPGLGVPLWQLHRRRARRAVQGGAVDHLPRRRARSRGGDARRRRHPSAARP